MTHSPSISAANRRVGKHQVEEQRESILCAAEELFLQNGLENTSMIDIARHAGINRVTLYRYFANRDEIAVQIQMRMMRKIAAVLPADPQAEDTLESHRQRAQAIIRSFPRLRNAYRYIGMFDKVYLDHAPGNPLAQWTKAQLQAGRAAPGEEPARPPHGKELTVILSTITWFLEKLALRGELTWGDPSVPLEDHLQFFEEMILRSFDLLSHPKE
jgi:AcrR family transcriptional regulator